MLLALLAMLAQRPAIEFGVQFAETATCLPDLVIDWIYMPNADSQASSSDIRQGAGSRFQGFRLSPELCGTRAPAAERLWTARNRTMEQPLPRALAFRPTGSRRISLIGILPTELRDSSCQSSLPTTLARAESQEDGCSGATQSAAADCNPPGNPTRCRIRIRVELGT